MSIKEEEASHNSYIVIWKGEWREKNSVVVLIMRRSDALFTNPTYIRAEYE